MAVVTGGNRGIGREISRQLIQRGLAVIVTARDQGSAQLAAAELSSVGDHVEGVGLDVRNEACVAETFERIVRDRGRIDVLVNNAGIAIDGDDHMASRPRLGVVRQTLETNMLGPWNCCAASIPVMRELGYGRIVNISSTMASLALVDSASSPAYRVSKAALNMLTRVLAAEVAGTGILVNAASPGYTKTDMSPDATRSVEQGADTPVWLATLPSEGPSGGFFFERQPLAW